MCSAVAEFVQPPAARLPMPGRPPKPKLRASLKAVDQATVANRIVLRGELAGEGAVIALEVLTQFLGLQSTDQPLQLDLRHVVSPDEFGLEVLSFCLGRITVQSRHVTLLLPHFPHSGQLQFSDTQLFLTGKGFPTTECLLAAESHRVLLVAARPKLRRQRAPRIAVSHGVGSMDVEASAPIATAEESHDSF